MPTPILLCGLASLFTLVLGCDSGPRDQKLFFEPIVDEQHVAFVTPMASYTGPGNPVYLPPHSRGPLEVDGLPLYLASESFSRVAPRFGTGADGLTYLFVEARVHLVRSTFAYPRPDKSSWEISFQKVVIDEVIRVETFRSSK